MTKIYHNPRCGTSRTVLDVLQQRGLNPEIIEYLKTPLDRTELAGLIASAGLSVRQAIRSKETIYRELDLDAPDLTDDQLLDAMVQHPILMNRPFVVTGQGARLCRPAVIVEEIL